MTVLYGIPNCDTIKKARVWLAERKIDYQFHDYKKAGIDDARLRRWISQVGWEVLLNRRSATWRKVSPAIKDHLDEAAAMQLMLDMSSIIKRPVLEHAETIHVGFKPEQYARIFPEEQR